MAPEFSRVVRRATFLLLALAAVAVEVAARDGRALPQSVGLAAVWIAIVAGMARLVPEPPDPRRLPSKWVLLLLVVLAAAPFAVEPLRRKWTGDGYPLEIQMVSGLRNMGLGLAACAGWLVCQRLACVVSLFLMLFATAMTSHPAMVTVLGLYTAIGGVWLMLVYWGGLKTAFVAADKVVAVQVREGREGLPWLGLALLVLGIGAGLAVAVVGSKRTAFVLGEWMPTSGGTGNTDPFARRGIGDGPEETAGDNARSAGMVETEKMIEDNNNSLIDAVNDAYGPPHKPPKERERMVAAGKVDVIQHHGKLPDNRRPSRDFDTSRQGPKNAGKPRSREARALFEVSGRTPLHIRRVAFVEYDVAARRWLEALKPGNRLIESMSGDWMRLGHFTDSTRWYLEDERHQLKAAAMNDNLVPAPALLSRFRIGKVNRPDYYDWEYEGVLVLAGRKKTPPGVIVSTVCRTLEPSRLPESAFGANLAGRVFADLRHVPESIRPAFARIAAAWAGGEAPGWPQIEAVLAKLRAEYTLDRDLVAPADHPAPVLWFLTESRRGPDYLFAASTVFLLRALGYPTRVCLGYYAAPAAFDPETAHTPVRESDIHFWPEIRLQDGNWLVVEPTPGYEVLGPNLPLSERILSMLAALAEWTWRHIVECAGLIIALTAALVRRREIIDATAVRLWTWFPGPSWREQVRGAVRILERRGRWAGKPRPHGQTVLSWFRNARQRRADADLDRLTGFAEWAAYGPNVPPWPESEVLAVCRRVLGTWTLKRWHEANPTSMLGV